LLTPASGLSLLAAALHNQMLFSHAKPAENLIQYIHFNRITADNFQSLNGLLQVDGYQLTGSFVLQLLDDRFRSSKTGFKQQFVPQIGNNWRI
jgi:hypothetical protein